MSVSEPEVRLRHSLALAKGVAAALGAVAGIAGVVVLVFGGVHEAAAPKQSVTVTPPTTPTQPPAPQPHSNVFADVDRIVASLPIGHVAYTTPDSLGRDDQGVVKLLVSPRQSIERLKQKLSGVGHRAGATVKISDEMKATLTSGGDFEVTPVGESVQLVTSSGVTRWRWVIRPKRTGVLHLYLALTAIVDVNGQSRPLDVRTFNRTLSVRVGWPTRLKDFAKGNWQWLWTAIFVPIVLWAIRERKRRQEEAQQETAQREAALQKTGGRRWQRPQARRASRKSKRTGQQTSEH